MRIILPDFYLKISFWDTGHVMKQAINAESPSAGKQSMAVFN
jgi:hypothetical protein